MNTSYNKDRIVDDGWKYVFLNSIRSICPWFSELWMPHQQENNRAEDIPDENAMTTTNDQPRLMVKPEPNVSIISLEDKSEETELNPCTSEGKQADPEASAKILCNQVSTDSEEATHIKQSPNVIV